MQAGLAAPRAISFAQRGNPMVAQGGRTSRVVVSLAKPTCFLRPNELKKHVTRTTEGIHYCKSTFIVQTFDAMVDISR